MSLRILFICGSFEPGRDGVGDYVRRLSIDLSNKGHVVAVAAINDSHIVAIEDKKEQTGNGELSVFRLPAGLKESDKWHRLKNWVDNFNPEWLSLQYVPYSFHPKGLIFGLSGNLKNLGKGRKWHIMFHELWIGMNTESNTKELIYGGIQRYLANGLINALKPVVIHTHTDLYKKQLEKTGAQVSLLPLFSNIPVVHPEVVSKKISQVIVPGKKIDVVIFGGIHAGAAIGQLAKEAAAYASKTDSQINLVIIGRNGKEQERWTEEWKDDGLSIEQLGEQSEEKVSEMLENATFGIFTTPIALVEKSGSVCAMREHGLHLLCVSREWTPKGIQLNENPYHILIYKEGNLTEFLTTQPDFSYMPVLKTISEQFVTNLTMN